ncbi:MAG TPA: hypothetical protein VLL97_01170 [Acidobacteriota bacterium]|nr:hypothetical protein [Acidobacteriota bacterium]
MIPERETSHFSSCQRKLVYRAMEEAEERATEYYCIPPFRWEQLRYDLLTREDREWEPFPGPTLARIRCLQRIRKDDSFDFYRIELNDPGILDAAKRERLANDIYPFFVYILTHEMVHMIRLNSILDDKEKISAPHEVSEECRVREISRKVLARSGFHSVFERFCG